MCYYYDKVALVYFILYSTMDDVDVRLKIKDGRFVTGS